MYGQKIYPWAQPIKKMKGKVVILAGGSGGLGSAVAEMVAGRGGVPVIGCLKNRDRADDLARGLREKYGIVPPGCRRGYPRFIDEAALVGRSPQCR